MRNTLLAIWLILASGAALADGALIPKHKGVMAEAASGNRTELTLEGGKLMIFLTNHHDEEIDTKGASGEITLLTGNEKRVLGLKASGGNSLMAEGTIGKAAAGTKALARIALPGKAVEQFRLVLK